MNKTEFIEAVAQKAELTKADAKKAVNAFCDVIAEAMKKDEKATIIGFGTFSTSERAARTGINPQTGKKMHIAARKSVKFKAGSGLDLKK